VEALHGLSIRPSTKELYGTLSTSENSVIYRVSAEYGTVLKYRTFQIPNIRAIAFTTAGDTLYGATTGGKVYRLNVDTGDTAFVGQASGIPFASLAFSPTSGKLWAGVRPGLSGKDKLYTVNTTSGAVTLVGAVGNSQINAGLAFSPQGVPYVLTGSGSQLNSLYSVDTLTGKGTLIGSTGQQNLSGLALRSDGAVGVDDRAVQGTIPQAYQLSQNYPNPFNPDTRIMVALPFKSQISLVVYDILGQEVAQLANGVLPAGTHSFAWAGLNQKGNPVAGGMYLYRLDAKPLEGSSKNDFVEVKKMILLK
jgi:WD40 repeat protein